MGEAFKAAYIYVNAHCFSGFGFFGFGSLGLRFASGCEPEHRAFAHASHANGFGACSNAKAFGVGGGAGTGRDTSHCGCRPAHSYCLQGREGRA